MHWITLLILWILSSLMLAYVSEFISIVRCSIPYPARCYLVRFPEPLGKSVGEPDQVLPSRCYLTCKVQHPPVTCRCYFFSEKNHDTWYLIIGFLTFQKGPPCPRGWQCKILTFDFALQCTAALQSWRPLNTSPTPIPSPPPHQGRCLLCPLREGVLTIFIPLCRYSHLDFGMRHIVGLIFCH